MAGPISVSVDMQGFDPWKNGVTKRTWKAAMLSGIDAVRRMKAEGSRQIRQRKKISTSTLKQEIKIVQPTSAKDALVWAVKVGIVAMPMYAYGTRPKQPVYPPPRKGVSVEINVGRRVTLPHAFIATMKSGHTGVFMRYGQATKRPAISGYRGNARYRGRKRQPIRELWTTRISDAFTDAIPFMAETGRTKFIEYYMRKVRTL